MQRKRESRRTYLTLIPIVGGTAMASGVRQAAVSPPSLTRR